MLNMQSANAAGPAAGIPPQETMGNELQTDGVTNSKTNSETVARVDTNHEGVIVSKLHICILTDLI